jgi:hypothetical protein
MEGVWQEGAEKMYEPKQGAVENYKIRNFVISTK